MQSSEQHSGQCEMKHERRAPALQNKVQPDRTAVGSLPCSSGLLVSAQLAPLPRMKSGAVKSPLPWQGAALFSKKPFCTWGIFTVLLWEVASSFPKNIHPLFKQSALEGLWSLEEGCGYCEILSSHFDAGCNVLCLQAERNLEFARTGSGRGE